MPKFNNVDLTPETMQRTRQHFADICMACIDEVMNGAVKLPSHTDKDKYFADYRGRAVQYLDGKYDTGFTFLQRAHYLQTGEMVALLPK